MTCLQNTLNKKYRGGPAHGHGRKVGHGTCYRRVVGHEKVAPARTPEEVCSSARPWPSAVKRSAPPACAAVRCPHAPHGRERTKWYNQLTAQPVRSSKKGKVHHSK